MSPPTYRDIERIEKSIEGLDQKVDKISDQVTSMRTDTTLLIDRIETEAKLRHQESQASERRTKILLTVVGPILIAVASQMGWIGPQLGHALSAALQQTTAAQSPPE